MSEQPVRARLEGLAVGYAQRGRLRPVLEGIDAELERGELVCVLGPNGVGKSTLLRTVAGLQDPLAGRVLLDGEDVRHLVPRERARRLAVVLTEPLRVGLLRAEDLVALGRYPHTDWAGRLAATDRDRVRRALELVGAEGLARRPVGELSDGERQKVMIARAIAQDADLLVLDEPTAFLDLTRRVEVMAILRRLARDTGHTLLVATHDLDLALRGADRLWLLRPGGGVEMGAPEDLVLDGALAKLFESALASFDPHSGAFHLAVTGRGRARLAGPPGLVREWTVRALRREGIEVLDAGDATGGPGAEAELVVELEEGAGRRLWRSRWVGEEMRHASLGDLLQRVRSIVEADRRPRDPS